MSVYAVSYISGLGEIVENKIKTIHCDAKIIKHFDGLLVFETNHNLVKMPFVNNIFYVFSMKDSKGQDLNNDIKFLVKNSSFNFQAVAQMIENKKSFKILTLDQNQPCKCDYSILAPLENKIVSTLKLKLVKGG